MAYVLTYNTLIPSLLDYVERDDAATTAALPLLIMLAQQRIARDTKTLFLETYVTNAFTNGSNVLQKPANWLNTITFNVGSNVNNNTRSQVQLASYEKCRQYAPDDTVTGLPKYYCDYGYDNWLIVPTPDQDYPFEIAYQGTAIPIDATVQTNQITQKSAGIAFLCMFNRII